MRSATMKGSDSPVLATMQIVDILERPGWDAEQHTKVKDALKRADTFEKQQQLLTYAIKHAPSPG